MNKGRSIRINKDQNEDYKNNEKAAEKDFKQKINELTKKKDNEINKQIDVTKYLYIFIY